MNRANKVRMLIIAAIPQFGLICINGGAPTWDRDSHFELCERIERGDFACTEETRLCRITACAGERGSCMLNDDPEVPTESGAVGHWVDRDLMDEWLIAYCERRRLIRVFHLCGPAELPYDEQYGAHGCGCDNTRPIYNCPGSL
jgi:hypothetical protein